MPSASRCAQIASLFVLVAAWAERAAAHAGHGTMGGGFTDGFLHPVTGLDHLVAMIAVGLWGAQLGVPAIWLLPIAFPLVMAAGGFLGVIDAPFPAVNAVVALSGVVLGALVAMAARTPLWIAALVVGTFGVLHGHAHGTAMPLSGAPVAFGAGFVVATGLLHLSGILIGLLTRWPSGAMVVRAGGVAIALVAGYSLVALLVGAR
jgi:urease accessory protein